MRILVTGGGGFIGSHVSEALLDAGHDVLVLDRDPVYVDPRAELVEEDLAHPGVAARAVSAVDVVCHRPPGWDWAWTSVTRLATSETMTWPRPSSSPPCRPSGFGAGWSSPARWWSTARDAIAVPTMGWSARRPAIRRISRWAGSTRTCPSCGAAVQWVAVDEDAPTDPRSVYAVSKLTQEHLCRLWSRETGGTVVALRYHNVYGRRLPMDTPYSGVAALFRSALRLGDAPKVFEDGRQTRDFVHVGDVARANLLALAVPQAPGTARRSTSARAGPRRSPRWPVRWLMRSDPMLPGR